MNEAKAVLNIIKETKPNVMCAKRHPEYMEDRLSYRNSQKLFGSFKWRSPFVLSTIRIEHFIY